MDKRERHALESLRFDAVPTEKTLFAGRLSHVSGVNQTAYDRIRREIEDLRSRSSDSPPGIVVHGEQGSGKSHLLWWARRLIAGLGGYYFNIRPDGDPETLWTRVAGSMLRDLCESLDVHQFPATPTTQLLLAVERLVAVLDLPEPTRAVLSGRVGADPDELRTHVDSFRAVARGRFRNVARRNVALALVLLAVEDDDANAVAWSFLHDEAADVEAQEAWGLLRAGRCASVDVVEHMSHLLGLTGPALFVVDQIDDLVARSGSSTEIASSEHAAGDLAAELMSMREKLTRSLTVISCLDHTWRSIKARSVKSALDRFPSVIELEPIRDPEVARRLVVKFLAPQFDRAGFTVPHETWPVAPEAFAGITAIRPRRLIQRVGEHVQTCLSLGESTPLTSFAEPETPAAVDEPANPTSDRVNGRYLDHCRSIAIDAVKESAAEKNLAGLLTVVARGLLIERGIADVWTVRDTGKGADNPSTHAELAAADGRRVYLRGLNVHHAKAVGSRLDNARGLVESIPEASLLVMHTNPWKNTPRIENATTDVLKSGGVIVDVNENDLRTLRGVELTADVDAADVREWLRRERPVSGTEFGRRLIGLIDPAGATPTDIAPIVDDSTPVAEPPAEREIRDAAIPFGVGEDGRVLDVELSELRKHVAVFAGSGSGKTVLLRRIIEEAALRGVGTIVLDPNNDLARLGDAWPSDPDGWWPGDDARAREYLANTEVVVWTPGVSKGRPLTLAPFPDFSAVRDDPDELRLAVDTAVASLAPRARIDGANHMADGRRAILRETLLYFAEHGGGDLDRLIDLLLDPPEDILDLPNAAKHASYVASALSYARSNDPLFDGEGTVFDPDRLLTPADGHRARVSVINLAGIPEENRPAFINRLQMALFSWIKRNPARDRPLSGLFVMDEAQTFIPSGKVTPCTESTRNLASQARKYGLGLVYATQAPRGIDSRITGNATTHVYGRFVVPAQVGAVHEMAQARGSETPKVAILGAGEFIGSFESRPMAAMTVPMCLSHHGSPLEAAEIVVRARPIG